MSQEVHDYKLSYEEKQTLGMCLDRIGLTREQVKKAARPKKVTLAIEPTEIPIAPSTVRPQEEDRIIVATIAAYLRTHKNATSVDLAKEIGQGFRYSDVGWVIKRMVNAGYPIRVFSIKGQLTVYKWINK